MKTFESEHKAEKSWCSVYFIFLRKAKTRTSDDTKISFFDSKPVVDI